MQLNFIVVHGVFAELSDIADISDQLFCSPVHGKEHYLQRSSLLDSSQIFASCELTDASFEEKETTSLRSYERKSVPG